MSFLKDEKHFVTLTDATIFVLYQSANENAIAVNAASCLSEKKEPCKTGAHKLFHKDQRTLR
jgi:hypothetical protein